MLTFRDRLSPRSRYLFGFWMCPLLAWFSLVAQFLLLVLYARQMDAWISRLQSGQTPIVSLLWSFLAYILYWLTLAGFSGFAAAFFWKDFVIRDKREMRIDFWHPILIWERLAGKKWESNAALGSVGLTWLPSVAFGKGVAYFVVPFIVFLWLYIFSLKKSMRFWKSNHPREWLGDFSKRNTETR